MHFRVLFHWMSSHMPLQLTIVIVPIFNTRICTYIHVRRVFHIQATPKEIGYLMTLFDKDHTGRVDSREFMLKFTAIGKHIRSDKRKAFLAAKRAAEKAAIKEEEDKLAAQWEKV